LDDGDMNTGTNPADGIYVVAMQVRMATLDASVPFYMVFGPPAAGFLPARNAAVQWVQERLDTLAIIPVPGDYNFDGFVDAADYVVWRNTETSTTELAADGDLSGVVDSADYDFWRANFGAVADGAGVAVDLRPVPEGISLALALVASSCVICSRYFLYNRAANWWRAARSVDEVRFCRYAH
jgi:hypothetical protein